MLLVLTLGVGLASQGSLAIRFGLPETGTVPGGYDGLYIFILRALRFRTRLRLTISVMMPRRQSQAGNTDGRSKWFR